MKTERLVIKCCRDLKVEFREFAAKYKDQEAALKALLEFIKGKGYVLRI